MTTILDRRVGGWIQTYSGKLNWPLDPRPEDFDIGDIAHALSNICRYGGHCCAFYSVAEHSILLAEKAPKELKLAALMHDASEGCGLGDILQPIKHNLPEYESAEAKVMRALSTRFKFPYPSQTIKELDTRILLDERAQCMATPPTVWNCDGLEPLGVTLEFMTPMEAKDAFIICFDLYGGFV